MTGTGAEDPEGACAAPTPRRMPAPLRAYVRLVEGLCRRIGRATMYLLFALMAVLLWSSISKTFFLPAHWTLETAQFALVAYFMLGGPYALQMGSNVRMDLFYSAWSPRRRAWADALTVSCLLVYLSVLLWGGLGSLAYSLGYFGSDPLAFYVELAGAAIAGTTEETLGFLERSRTIWRPYMWPIKALMCLAALLMILQALALLIRDIATIRGEEL